MHAGKVGHVNLARCRLLVAALALLAAAPAAVRAADETYDGGGYPTNGSTLDDNTVMIQRGEVNDPVIGGSSHRTAIHIDDQSGGSGPADAAASLENIEIGVFSQTATVEADNTVTGEVYGGAAFIHAQAGAVAGAVNATNTTATASATANANATANASANANTVHIGQGATLAGSLYGGMANITVLASQAKAADATVNVYADADADATATTYAFATAYASAYTSASTAHANENTVSMGQSTTLGGSLYGGMANITALASEAKAADATANVYADASASASASATAYAFAFGSTAEANANAVLIGQGATLAGSLYGGMANFTALACEAKAADATATASATASATATAYATAYAYAYGSTVKSNANTVHIGQGATLAGSLYGGMANLTAHAAATGGTTIRDGVANYDNATAVVNVSNSLVQANGNQVDFNGTLQGNLYGGYAGFDILLDATKADGGSGDTTTTRIGSNASATGNIVTIDESAQFGTTSSLYGGYLAHNPDFTPESYDVFTGNILNYNARTPTQLRTLANFQTINFALSPELANTGTALITAQEVGLGTNDSNTRSGTTTLTQVAVVGIHSGNVLSAGDQFLLVKADAMSGNGEGGQDAVTQAQQGISLLYDVETSVDLTNKQISAEILSCQTEDGGSCPDPVPTINPQLKSLSEGRLASLMLATRGADVVADQLYSTIQTENRGGLVPFILASGATNRYNSGSHIDSDDFLMTGGLSYRHEGLTAAVFAESGWGNYDTYNSFATAASVRGDGNTRYTGGGVFGRYDFTSGLYAEASVRLGNTRTRFDTGDLVNLASGESAHYNLHSRYTSAHAGVGYPWVFDDSNVLDVSAKYLWTHVDGKDATVAGDPLHFDSVQSQRVRVNGEYRHRHSDSVTLLAGLGYEYEFDAKANGTAYGYAIDAPSLKGSTGILSLGASITPTSNRRLSVDLRGEGYVGKREGVGGLVRVNYAFM